MYFVYVLKSRVTGKLYTGHTHDLKRRVIEHNTNRSLSTSFRGPFDIAYHESVSTRSEAVRREQYLKSGFGRQFLKSKGF